MRVTHQLAAMIWLQGYLTSGPKTSDQINLHCPYKPKALKWALDQVAFTDADDAYTIQDLFRKTPIIPSR